MKKELWNLKRSKLLLLIPLSFIIFLVVKNSEFVAEYVFARGLYRVLSIILGIITGFIPFSISEIVIICMPALLIVFLSLFIKKLLKNKNKWKFIVAKPILNILCFFSVLIFTFMLLCGANYYRYDFAKYCDFNVEEYTIEELYQMCLYLGEKVNESKEFVSDIDENGVVVLNEGFKDIPKKTNDAMDQLANQYPVLKYSTGSAKKVLLSRYMSYGRTVGIFIPFTMEANVNTDVLDYNRPADTLHELAHMRGFMKEDEANYISYLACINYDDPVFQYSGYMLAFIHSTNALYKYDAAKYYEVMDNLSELVLADIIAESQYWDEISKNEIADVVDTIATTVNDTYLKVNGQSDGIKSYGQMVDLLLADYIANIIQK